MTHSVILRTKALKGFQKPLMKHYFTATRMVLWNMLELIEKKGMLLAIQKEAREKTKE